jgi:hypothetical protein
VITGLLFGGGTAVSAAQDDLPDQPLYQLKLWTEAVSLQFQNQPEEKVERLMELAQLRVQEMVQLAEEGNPVPDQVRQRLEQHIQQALQICGELEDAELEGCLLQLQEQLQYRYREMEQLMTNAPEGVEPIMEQTRTMLQLHLNLVGDGLLDPEMFRNIVRNGFRFGQEDDEMVPPFQNGSGQQNGQPASSPGGPNTAPDILHDKELGPHPDEGGPNNVNGDPNSNNGGENSNGNQGGGVNNGGGNDGSNSGGGGSGGNSGGGGSGGGH